MKAKPRVLNTIIITSFFGAVTSPVAVQSFANDVAPTRMIQVIRNQPSESSVIIKPRHPDDMPLHGPGTSTGRSPASANRSPANFTDGRLISDKKIMDLQLDQEQGFPISFELVGDTMQPTTELVGRYSRPDWNLVFGTEKIAIQEDGSFRKKVPLQYGENQLRLYAVGPLGRIEIQEIDVGQVDENKNKGRGPSNIFLTHGLSYSTIRYQDGRLASPLLMQALTAKLAYVYLLSSRWDLSASAYLTAVQLASTVESNTRFFGANFRLAYQFSEKTSPWQFSLGSGLFYSTMIVPIGGYGFNDVVGPQVLPVLKRLFSKGNSISAYGKFALISGGRETAAGLSYGIPLQNGKSISLSLDYSIIDIVVENIPMKSNSASIGASFTL